MARRRRIAAPAEVLPSWHRGFETAVRNDVARDAFRFGLYTGMRRLAEETRGWVFPSETSASGHLEGMQHLNARIGEAGGARFWFHALRNCFISVAGRDLMLAASLNKRLVNHARPQDAAQRIADKIDALIRAGIPAQTDRAA